MSLKDIPLYEEHDLPNQTRDVKVHGGDIPEGNHVYAMINSKTKYGFLVIAFAADGTDLARHACTHEGYFAHDIGLTSDWKHERYLAHYPEGFTLEWVPRADINDRPDVMDAISRGRAKDAAAGIAAAAAEEFERSRA